MPHSRRRSFSDLVHVGKVFIGGKTEGGRPTPKKAVRALVGRIAAVTGGMTAYRARGIYRSSKQPFVSEPTTVIETFVSAGRSCEKFKSSLKRVAESAAREGFQETIGVEVQCVGSRGTDVEFVTPKRRTSR